MTRLETTTPEMSLAESKVDDLATVCKVMMRFADTPAVITAFAVKLCCGISALVLFAWLAKVRPRNRTLHINAYNILYAHFIFVLISSIGVVMNDGFDLTRLTVFRRIVDYKEGSNECGIFSMPARYGVWIRLITFFGNTGSTLTMTALAVERTYATIQSRSYEKESKPGFGRLLVFLAVVVNFALKTFIAVHINYQRYLPMQSLSAEAAPYATCVLYINTGCEVFNILVFVFLWFANHKWKKSVGRILATLTHKYQVEENMKSVAIMISLASLHFLINIIAYFIQLYGTWHDETPQEKMEYVIKGDVAPTYDFLLPLLTLCRIYYKKRRVHHKNSLHGIMSPVENISTNDHFQMLNGMFDKALDQTIAKKSKTTSASSKSKDQGPRLTLVPFVVNSAFYGIEREANLTNMISAIDCQIRWMQDPPVGFNYNKRTKTCTAMSEIHGLRSASQVETYLITDWNLYNTEACPSVEMLLELTLEHFSAVGKTVYIRNGFIGGFESDVRILGRPAGVRETFTVTPLIPSPTTMTMSPWNVKNQGLSNSNQQS
ncbi:hypothetical protein QR680_011128 [Steinernema hermaphroditum]|uniref:G-protein coupled receptors family 1 profile domain-containing protein n=1 Tax=Steinernema hermaphroditum TaxID=289476 RepID=A0AA39ISE4_9BILA|nr:hypothetical protein QR680_011128 [Steinernema hermaphroditum]